MTISKKKKLRKKILNSLKDQAELSTNRGKVISTPFKLTKKQRRNSGWRHPKIFVPQKILDEEGIFVDCYWDNWGEYRDGFRDNADPKHIFKRRKRRFWKFSDEDIKEINKRNQKKLMRKHISKNKK